MNYTLKQLAQLFVDTSAGGQEVLDTPLDVRDVVMYMRIALNGLLKAEVFTRMGEGDKSAVSNYLITESLALSADSTEKRKIAILTDWYTSLPHNKGVWRVSDAKNPNRIIIPEQNPGVLNMTRTRYMEEMMIYTLEGKKLIFQPHKDLDTVSRVLVKYVTAAPSSVSESTELPVAPEQVEELFLRTKRLIGQPLPQDVLNNGSGLIHN